MVISGLIGTDARPRRRLFRRPRRHGGDLPHHGAAGDAGDPGGARRRRHGRRLAAGRDPGARAAQMGPLRGGHARRDPAGARARLRRRRARRSAPRRRASSSARCCPTCCRSSSWWRRVEAASAILLEAALSFLGLGVQPPLPSWGLMIAEAKTYMFFSFWLIAIPGTALALLVLRHQHGRRRHPRRVRRRAGEADVTAPLLSVEGLVGRHRDAARHAARGARHLVRHRARRDAVHRRRIRLRQVDDRARADGPAARRRHAPGAPRSCFEGEDLARTAAERLPRCAATAWR